MMHLTEGYWFVHGLLLGRGRHGVPQAPLCLHLKSFFSPRFSGRLSLSSATVPLMRQFSLLCPIMSRLLFSGWFLVANSNGSIPHFSTSLRKRQKCEILPQREEKCRTLAVFYDTRVEAQVEKPKPPFSPISFWSSFYRPLPPSCNFSTLHGDSKIN